MKKKIYFGGIALLSAAVAVVAYFNSSQKNSVYQPRIAEEEMPSSIQPMLEYMYKVRANQITGLVDPKDVQEAREDVTNFKRLNKATFPLSWSNAGPDNMGGRTRAFLIDRNNNNVLYAGGVMGGLFKSTNKGASWYPINDAFESMAVASICQTPNGDIYFGTGEGFTGNGGQKAFTPGFAGNGIYRSTDNGETFERIPTTGNFNYVNRLASHPTKNYVLAATNLGLYASNESDPTQTWSRVLPGNARDIAIDKNGHAFVYTSRVYRSTNPTDDQSYTAVEGAPLGGARMTIAVSPSDPNYVYILAVGNVSIDGPQQTYTVNDGLTGIYQSKDNGKNFSRIVGKANPIFAPFTHQNLMSSQGTFNCIIAVHPYNKERLFIGGVQFAEWTDAGGPIIVGNTANSPFNPFGIHADKHWIAFDTVSKPAIMYICTDGGISKTTNAQMNRYTDINNGYQTTQFYGIAAGTNGTVFGGTQDQGGILINRRGSTPEAGVRVNGGDNYQCEISRIDPQVIFMEAYYSLMTRSLNEGSNGASIWDSRVREFLVDNTEPISRASNIPNAPLRLWENVDSMQSRLFLGLNGEVWMANEAVTSPNPQWFRIANTGVDPYHIDFTPDGNTLFIAGLNGSRIYRVDGLNDVTWDTTALPSNTIAPELTMTDIKSNLPGRTITSIEVDDNNPDRVIVTMGNYGNSSYVYVTENSLDASPTWRSIQGALPRFPVYDAEINVANPDEIILGTEYGIYACQNGTATTPTWVENNDNFPLVPVFELRQVESKNVQGPNPWRTGAMLYAGTHGRGIFKSNDLLTSYRPVNPMDIFRLYLYPNPGNEYVNVKLPSTAKGEVKVTVMNISGQVLINEQRTLSSNSFELITSQLERGNYIVQVEGAGFKGTSKFVKMN